MWDHIQRIGANPLSVLDNPGNLFLPAPKTGMKFMRAASVHAKDTKVSEASGSTYVEKSPSDGARFNNKGQYTVSDAQRRRDAAEDAYRQRTNDMRQRKYDLIIAEMLREQQEYLRSIA